ncbi:Gfo/Idh/MocA family protein [Streptomyces radiopugnans]|uniref:Gfo/Idh/MocA family protein n=1 Tax=Streptomyces radiopugnans TaxID=403935 RepID=UPI003F1BBA1A
MPTTRIGFVGGGFVAGRHAESLAQMEDVEIAAVAEPRASARDAFVRRTGARPYAGHETMLDAERLDALYICVPPYAHGAPEEAAIERGLPFFVEKPLANTAETAERIAAAVRRSGLVTAAGYHWRYFSTTEEAARLLADSPPALVLGHWLDRTPGTEWWVDQRRSGGQLVEQVTHLFDLARLLAGEFDVVHAQGSRCPAVTGGDIHHAATCALRFASGAVGTLASTCLLRHGHRIGMEFLCDGMAVVLTERDLTVDDGARRQTVVLESDPFVREDTDFVTAVRGGPNRIRVPYEEALHTHRLTLAAARALDANDSEPEGRGADSLRAPLGDGGGRG